MTYFAVRVVAAGYILYKVWRAVFGRRVWEWIFARRAEVVPEVVSVLGRTNRVALSDPRIAVPVAESDLEPTGFIGAEEPEYDPTDEELYDDAPPPDENEMSSGVAFEDLAVVAEELAGDVADEERRAHAAKTLHTIDGTELMDFLVREVCNAQAIETLLRQDLDGDAPPPEFEMERYV